MEYEADTFTYLKGLIVNTTTNLQANYMSLHSFLTKSYLQFIYQQYVNQDVDLFTLNNNLNVSIYNYTFDIAMNLYIDYAMILNQSEYDLFVPDYALTGLNYSNGPFITNNSYIINQTQKDAFFLLSNGLRFAR